MARKRKGKPPVYDLAYFEKMGAIGGKLGAAARMANTTPEQRSESARKAVNARWARVKGKKAQA